jgi:hypothetical protein
MEIRRCKGQMLRRRASPQKTEGTAGVKFGIVHRKESRIQEFEKPRIPEEATISR